METDEILKNYALHEKLGDNVILQLLEAHFRDDKKEFAEIKNNQLKFQEINKQNGEHFSHFNVLILEIKKMLQDHMKRVEPMVLSYEKDKQFYGTGKDKLYKWGGRAVFAASVIGAWYAIKAFIISQFHS